MDIPEDTPLDPVEFHKPDLDALTGEPDDRLYCQLSSKFTDESEQAKKEGQFKKARILKLFSDVCAVTWDQNKEHPYDKSSLCDLKDPEVLNFLRDVVFKVENHRLRGRIRDFLWLLSKPRDPQEALDAIDAFGAILTTPENLSRDDQICLDRALQLCRQIKKKDPGKLQSLEDRLLQAFKDAGPESGCRALRIHRLLHTHKLAQPHHKEWLDKLTSLAKAFFDQRDFSTSCAYYKAAREITEKHSPEEAELSVKIAKSLVSEADTRLFSDLQGKNLAAHRLISEAIQQYLQVPHKHRDIHQVDKQADGLRKRLNSTGKAVLDELNSFPGEDVPAETKERMQRIAAEIKERIQRIAEDFPRAMKGKDLPEAMELLTFVANAEIDPDHVKEVAKQICRDNPTKPALRHIKFAADGRKVAEGPMDYRLMAYQLCASQAVFFLILPALEIIHQEHEINEKCLLQLVWDSPVVPQDRAISVTSGLSLGFQRDFMSALHYLIPQMEHMVRYNLRLRGIETRIWGKNGIETEKALGALLNNFPSDIEEIFGKRTCFEFHFLFKDDFGPNQRNDFAHGLLNDSQCQSWESIYIWWLMFKIIFENYQKEPITLSRAPASPA